MYSLCIFTYIHTYIHTADAELIINELRNVETDLNKEDLIPIYIFIYIYLYTYIHTYMHTYIHTYTQPMQSLSLMKYATRKQISKKKILYLSLYIYIYTHTHIPIRIELAICLFTQTDTCIYAADAELIINEVRNAETDLNKETELLEIKKEKARDADVSFVCTCIYVYVYVYACLDC